MLILGRCRNQGITITLPDGRTIHVLYLDQHGEQIRLGLTAPKDVSIWRDEIHQARNGNRNGTTPNGENGHDPDHPDRVP